MKISTDDCLAALILDRAGKPGALIVTIKAYMREQGLSATDMSARSGVSNAALSRCLRGESDIGYSTLMAIVSGLGLRASAFFLRLESTQATVTKLEKAIKIT
jgi:transcriptional regulator with XRE-family HTH domain